MLVDYIFKVIDWLILDIKGTLNREDHAPSYRKPTEGQDWGTGRKKMQVLDQAGVQ